MDYLAELRKRAITLKREQARADATRAEFFDLIRQALADGIAQNQIAEATGYSRERLRIIAKPKP